MSSLSVSRRPILPVLGLVLAALFWGASFPAMKLAEELPAFYVLCIRFAVASVLLSLLFLPRFRRFNRRILQTALVLSLVLFCMYALATVGIKYTTSSRASFFTCMTFVTVPILNLLLFRVRWTRVTLISVILCFAGVYLLCYTGEGAGFTLNTGDLICIGASVASAAYILLLGRSAGQPWMDSVLYTIALMAFIALWSGLLALFTNSWPEGLTKTTPPVVLDLIFLGVFCSCCSTLLQSLCQRHVPANRVGVIFAMEPASGCIFSLLILHESMTAYAWSGALLVMVSLLYMEIAGNRGPK